jgi:hypothetical protein
MVPMLNVDTSFGFHELFLKQIIIDLKPTYVSSTYQPFTGDSLMRCVRYSLLLTNIALFSLCN